MVIVENHGVLLREGILLLLVQIEVQGLPTALVRQTELRLN